MRKALLAGVAATLFSLPAHAILIDGVEFPQGAASFADQVMSYAPGLDGASPSAIYQGAQHALGIPDHPGGNTCTSLAACSWVSLGVGGQLVLRFTDNKLTGSGSSALDLWIFEVGSDVEATLVEVSTDLSTWYAVGGVGGSTSGIDLDAFGFGPSHEFGYIRLTDVANQGGTTGNTVGADIDAVGAISTVLTPIPEPSTYGLLLAGLGLLGFAARRRS